jgi:A/G-specific adenine glycosylase
VLVAAVMAQQTQMPRVLPKFDEFMAAFPNIEALAAASAGQVLRAWAPLGYNMRALRLQRAARRIATEGGFPRTDEELRRIDGIGPFTAAIVSSFAFGEPVAAVDTNVVRIVERLTGVRRTLPALEVQRTAQRLLSRRAPGRWNQAMMDLGAQVCTSRAPRCNVCPLAPWCSYRRSSRRASERRAAYRTAAKEPFRQSSRYYRGRIVHALRDLPPGRSLSPVMLLRRLPDHDGLHRGRLEELIRSLERDGLVSVARGRVSLP